MEADFGRRPLCAAAILAGIVLGLAHSARAHGLQPSYLEVESRDDGRFDVTWKESNRAGGETPARKPFGQVEPRLPDHCRRTEQVQTRRLADARIQRWRIDCGDEGLTGRLRIEGLGRAGGSVLVHLDGPDRTETFRLDAGRTSRTVDPSATETSRTGGNTFVTYGLLGVEHILYGFDHLLFVLGLVLLVGDGRQLLLTITGFTLAHSITLGGATLGFVRLAPAPVEATIAASILLLAVEIPERDSDAETLTRRWPWVVSFGFGLLHGFGFAGALTELGLPPDAIPRALLAFNVGVEVGQLAFVGTIVLGAMGIERLGGALDVELRPHFRRASRYAIGTVAAYWLVSRSIPILVG